MDYSDFAFMCARRNEIHGNFLENIKSFISKKSTFRDYFPDGKTMLHWLCLSGDYESVEYAINNGQNPKCRDDSGRTPLFYAVKSRSPSKEEYLSVSEFLLEHGCDPNIVDAENNSAIGNISPMGIHGLKSKNEASLAMLNLLIRFGADVHMRQSKGDTLIHWANESTLKALLHFGFDVNAQNDFGCTPLMYAVQTGTAGLIKTLLREGGDPSIADKRGMTSLHYAAAEDDKSKRAVELLINGNAVLDALDEDGNTPMHFSVMFGNSKILEILLSAGANKNIKNNDGFTPEEFLDIVPSPYSSYSLWSKKKVIMKKLLSKSQTGTFPGAGSAPASNN